MPIAHDITTTALKRGKSVVTASKELMAKHGSELLQLAAQTQTDLMFEGAVAGGIPIIRTLKEGLAGDRIRRVVGIINGTTNFILTDMTHRGRDFAVALSDAQAHGYAEKDPTADVDGFDAMYKLAILSSIAYGSHIDFASIHREGIRRITATDIRYAMRLGYEIKLLAISAPYEEGIDIRVHPSLVPQHHPLASVHGVFNAIYLQSEPVGNQMYYGRGAGDGPTGSAVIGDIIDCARNIVWGATGRVPCRCYQQLPIIPISEVESQYYLRTRVNDQPGVIGKMATIFGAHGVSIISVLQQAEESDVIPGIAEIVWITHRVKDGKLQAAVAEVSST